MSRIRLHRLVASAAPNKAYGLLLGSAEENLVYAAFPVSIASETQERFVGIDPAMTLARKLQDPQTLEVLEAVSKTSRAPSERGA